MLKERFKLLGCYGIHAWVGPEREYKLKYCGIIIKNGYLAN